MPGLYLHIPFCEHKCIYCDFYSIAPKESRMQDDALVDRYLSALGREIDLRGSDPRFRSDFETVFFGGGTPSLLSPSKIDWILRRLSDRFHIRPDAEITLETNPGTVDRRKLEEFRSAGVNRLSVGIQSFHADELRFLTRIHSAEQARECIRNGFAAGFENVSLDLMFALPGQTIDRWKWTLDQALALGPTHLSCYSLIVEPNTPLFRMVQTKQVSTLDPETDAEMYEFTISYLLDHGYEQYEVSNFARPGFRSRHNSIYWDHGNYLGFGPSAHSFWQNARWWNLANVVGYSEMVERGQFPVAGMEELTEEQLREEAIFLGLRSNGIDLQRFQNRFAEDILTEHGSLVDRLISENLMIRSGENLRLTRKGYSVCDEICCSFL